MTLSLSLPDQDRPPTIPSILVDSLNAFRIRAAIGACASLNASKTNLEHLFRTRLPPAEAEAQRRTLLQAPFRDAVPCLGPDVLQGFPSTNPLEQAYAALAAGQPAKARRILDGLPERRVGATMAAFTWDYLYAEAWARRASGDTTGMRALLLSALTDIENMNMSTLEEVPQAAGFRRALQMLREAEAGMDATTLAFTWGAKAALLTTTQSRTTRK